MSHQGLYGEQVHAVLIQVGAKSMAERVAGKPALPAQSVLMCMDMPGKEKRYRWACPPRSVLGRGIPWAFRIQTSIVSGCQGRPVREWHSGHAGSFHV